MRVPNDTPLRVVQPKPNDDDDDVAVEGHKPHIPTGAYLARYLGHETAFLFAKAQKIFLRFEICEGAHQGVRLVRPYRVRRIVGKPGPGGKFILAAGSDMYRMLAR